MPANNNHIDDININSSHRFPSPIKRIQTSFQQELNSQDIDLFDFISNNNQSLIQQILIMHLNIL